MLYEGAVLHNLQTSSLKPEQKLHVLMLQSLGLKTGESIYVPSQPVVQAIAQKLQISVTWAEEDAAISVLYRPKETELLHRLSRMNTGRRIVVYNTEKDIDQISMRSLDLATAYIYDQRSGTAIRVFDPPPKKVGDFIHVEVSELSQAALLLHISRIASLR